MPFLHKFNPIFDSLKHSITYHNPQSTSITPHIALAAHSGLPAQTALTANLFISIVYSRFAKCWDLSLDLSLPFETYF